MSNGKRFRWMLDIAGRFSTHTTLSVIPVITEFPEVRTAGNSFLNQVSLVTQYLTGYNGKSGLAVWVNMPHTEVMPNTQGALRTFLVTEITVLESRSYNSDPNTGFAPDGVGFHHDDVAETLAAYIENWADGLVADKARVRIIFDDHEGWVPTDVRTGTEKFDMIGSRFQVQALTEFALPARCYAPRLTFGGGNCTLTEVTSGSTLKYTTDGTYPNGAAITYSAPFAVTTGATVLAIATKTSFDASDVAEAIAP